MFLGHCQEKKNVHIFNAVECVRHLLRGAATQTPLLPSLFPDLSPVPVLSTGRKCLYTFSLEQDEHLHVEPVGAPWAGHSCPRAKWLQGAVQGAAGERWKHRAGGNLGCYLLVDTIRPPPSHPPNEVMTEILNETLLSCGGRLRGLGLFGLEKKRGDLRATRTSFLVTCRSSWEEHFLSSWRVLIAITELRASRCCIENPSMMLGKCCRILRVFGHVWLTALHSAPGPDRDHRLSDMTKQFPTLNSFQMRIWQLLWQT